jgi:hypothetical protein
MKTLQIVQNGFRESSIATLAISGSWQKLRQTALDTEHRFSLNYSNIRGIS